MQSSQGRLKALRDELNREEEHRLSPWATFSRQAIRRRKEKELEEGHRQNFSIDTDRILHSLAYSRYIDKTQVFYLIKNDHITHRVLHVQLVSKIARTIGRLLRLNEDLIEAISLGHDIGHAPFGHDGEKFLSDISIQYGIGPFLHNVQGVRFLEKIERKGRGWNLTLQVLDGILSHNGEIHMQRLDPFRKKDFNRFDREMIQKIKDPKLDTIPMTLEGCVVRMADTISYIGRDVEDAIRLGIIKREELPKECVKVLGNTNGSIVYRLVEDIVAHSLERPYISFSTEVAEALRKLKSFNYRYIYTNKKVKSQQEKIRLMFELLFERYLKDLKEGNEDSDIFKEYLKDMSEGYLSENSPEEIVRDFISGMTDEYFLSQCKKLFLPEIRFMRI